ncbi:MAG: 50S ribosomal protein L32 [Candidatus Levybacteria bacterium RIFCSPLOWO2_02_FULL_37_10]|nr:MAG: 50S ribosomal protein L32 [Candidatus Levybacteria bacterium RIFCSPHIGHO2_01_FULL_37_33]OGH17638.1 MAG: 50S ribosomal protein L32 [Candidatus Levybacteria bacterium RIFCSPHIGHO2_02_FULL_37_11]OGH29319.1 MAG: 50S ribosomal protein L32 [Candidatus Levybacteria bacterium RIFCSPHIGHO2_12_FULL_37_12]OGH32441.1 MAG: 50S ribosomal protein L32 [Candidatus Levybacteria bacterium RIFCSPLOWO2_01_FULL_36_54]OGH43276.1 MAG: 50S ribosomal protein L32 [Candidatus Levybacteria bacterium RIFCSPLOWO2_02_
MPQEPKRRHSRQRKGKRRASIALKISAGIVCSNCGTLNPSHVVCKNCGFYKGKAVIVRKEKKEKEKNEKSP